VAEAPKPTAEAAKPAPEAPSRQLKQPSRSSSRAASPEPSIVDDFSQPIALAGLAGVMCCSRYGV